VQGEKDRMDEVSDRSNSAFGTGIRSPMGCVCFFSL
jgi:hypothetical protein